MNLTRKMDLDGLLKDWPAPSTRDEAAWDARADVIVEAAVAQRSKDISAIAALLDAPPLTPEPGEPDGGKNHVIRSDRGDENTMSHESDQDGGRKSSASLPSERKRGSLKEIAARASQIPLSTPLPGRASAVSTPLPPAISTPIPSRPGSMPSSRPSEAGKEDSGIIDLKVVNAEATPEQKTAAENARPGSTDLTFEDDKSPASAEARTQRRPTPIAQAAAKKKGSGGMIAGVGIAVIGLAAAFAIMLNRKDPAQQTQATQDAPAVAAEQPAPADPAAPSPTAAAAPDQPAAEQAANSDGKPAQDGKAAAGPSGAGQAPGGPAATAPEQPAAVAQGKPAAPAPTGKAGDLNSEMQRAVGDQNAKPETEAPEPAAGKSLNQNIPEQPSQGSAAAALGSSMSAAKACVAGADDVSRANVTFGSSGTVTSVSVSGWAASNGQSSCVKQAFKGANVGAFSKPSFTIGVTIRP